MFNSKSQFDAHPLEERQSHLERARNKALSMLDPQTQAVIRASDLQRDNNHHMCFAEGGGVETGNNPVNQAAPQLNQMQTNTQNIPNGVNNYMQTTAQNNQAPGTTPPQNLAQGSQSNTSLPNHIVPKY